MSSSAGPEIELLIRLLARLPGLGSRSARRAVLHLVRKRESLLEPLGAAMLDVLEKACVCSACGNVDSRDPCSICSDPSRERSTLVIVEDVSDLWALERAGAISCLYHVLGGVLSPLDGVGPEDLNMDGLLSRIRDSRSEVKEAILAVNATVEGQTTAHYLADLLRDSGVRISRLAHGVPVGGELDYLDEGTLGAAIRSRSSF